MIKRILLILPILIALSFAKAYPQNLNSDIKYFSGLDSRMPGYKGNSASADYIYKTLKNIGLTDLKKEEIYVTVPIDKGFSLQTSANEKIQLYSLWPNMVRTSTLPKDGIKGEIVFGGKGEYSDYNGKDIKNKIVVLDFNSGKNWAKAAGLGAKAIIFSEPYDTGRLEAEKKFTEVPIDVPRFMAPKSKINQIKKLEGREVTLKGRMEWQKVKTWNISGLIPGKNKNLSKQTIALSAYYDSTSVVPSKAPGAESACGIAALLELAKDIKNDPVDRPVMFVAVSGHFMGLKGIESFIQARRPISLFIGLDLSSQNDEFGVFHQGNFFKANSKSNYYQRLSAPFGDVFETNAKAICGKSGMDINNIFVNGIVTKKSGDWFDYIPHNIATDSEMMLAGGVPAVSLITVNDIRNKVDTTADTAEKINFQNLNKQASFLKQLVRSVINDKNLFPETKMEFKNSLCTLEGRVVTFNPKKSFVPDEPVENALVYIKKVPMSFMGVKGSIYELTDANGNFSISRLMFDEGGLGGKKVEAYKTDPESGRIVLAPDRGINGEQSYPLRFFLDWKIKKLMIVLFPCVSTDIYDIVDPRYLTQFDKINIFDLANSNPAVFGYCLAEKIRDTEPDRSSGIDPFGVVFSRPNSILKTGFASDIIGIRMLMLNSAGTDTKENSQGKGFEVNNTSKLTECSYNSAKDMYELNEFRINELGRYGVVNKSINEMHSKAKAALGLAADHKEKKEWDKYIKYSRRALGLEARAYPDVKATANDVVKGIVFYMALLIPFAFFMERLVFSFPDIKKQILGAFLIFLATYIVMRFVHPAFQITQSPEVILLSFIILTLSAIVVFILSSKFQEQMDKIKQQKTKVYQADVSRLNASAAAFTLGLSNMKRRKTRTFLTCFTLVLLTFILLSFTSIKNYIKFNKVPRPNKPAYEGILFRDRVCAPLEESAFDYLSSEFAPAVISPRAWIVSKETARPCHIKLKDTQNNKYAFASGAVGLSVNEQNITGLNKYLTAGKWFENNDEKTCIIPDDLAKLMAIEPQDIGKKNIRIFGQLFKVSGIFDTKALRQFRDLDNEEITPTDFSTLSSLDLIEVKESKNRSTGIEGKTKVSSFAHLDTGNIIFLPYNTAINLGGTIQSIAVTFPDDSGLKENIENFIVRLAGTIFAGIDNKTVVYSSLSMTSFSGMSLLLIPIFITSLIVLNTMLGSVYERIKEIGIYSSVGLAPVHIGALFIAEACVFAILGAIGGYLIGQVLAKIFSSLGILSGLTLNYSSMSAVISTMLVMVVVLLSTIYPARKAAQMSVPDVTRSWTLPKPESEAWKFEFPFTISGQEILGLFTFFKEYFSSYEGNAIGNFYTQETALSSFKEKHGDGYLISFKSWLAPFDLGVSQKVEMIAIPTADNGIYQIYVELHLLSGDMNTWFRLNRRFLNIIRKQFLVWRTVSAEVKEEYTLCGKNLI